MHSFDEKWPIILYRLRGQMLATLHHTGNREHPLHADSPPAFEKRQYVQRSRHCVLETRDDIP